MANDHAGFWNPNHTDTQFVADEANLQLPLPQLPSTLMHRYPSSNFQQNPIYSSPQRRVLLNATHPQASQHCFQPNFASGTVQAQNRHFGYMPDELQPSLGHAQYPSARFEARGTGHTGQGMILGPNIQAYGPQHQLAAVHAPTPYTLSSQYPSSVPSADTFNPQIDRVDRPTWPKAESHHFVHETEARCETPSQSFSTPRPKGRRTNKPSGSSTSSTRVRPPVKPHGPPDGPKLMITFQASTMEEKKTSQVDSSAKARFSNPKSIAAHEAKEREKIARVERGEPATEPKKKASKGKKAAENGISKNVRKRKANKVEDADKALPESGKKRQKVNSATDNESPRVVHSTNQTVEVSTSIAHDNMLAPVDPVDADTRFASSTPPLTSSGPTPSPVSPATPCLPDLHGIAPATGGAQYGIEVKEHRDLFDYDEWIRVTEDDHFPPFQI
ncbi:hypothetical protein VKT23_004539 [Stygiomarasmius scandens]|uniref:Uncharacterized protein n=1 Tax=Marasmiellus scandens TaxID=2682957 RepID=A0ABR1JUE2_9AGAR